MKAVRDASVSNPMAIAHSRVAPRFAQRVRAAGYEERGRKQRYGMASGANRQPEPRKPSVQHDVQRVACSAVSELGGQWSIQDSVGNIIRECRPCARDIGEVAALRDSIRNCD